MSDDAPHIHFTVRRTRYMSNFDRSEPDAWAIHYQHAPTLHANGSKSIGLVFPSLIVTSYLEDPEAVARKVAKILEQHWNDEE